MSIIIAGSSTLAMFIFSGVFVSSHNTSRERDSFMGCIYCVDVMVNVFASIFTYKHWQAWIFPYIYIWRDRKLYQQMDEEMNKRINQQCEKMENTQEINLT